MNYHLDDAAYTEGREAFEIGLTLSHCPYERNSNCWHLWIAGYSAAEFNLLR